jgi:hypothetical protein
MSKQNKKDKDQSLLQMFLSTSNTIDRDTKKATEIIREEGLDPERLKYEGMAFIKSLKQKVETVGTDSTLLKFNELLTKLTDAGIPKQLLEKRFIPSALKHWRRLGYSSRLQAFTSAISVVFSWKEHEVRQGNKLEISLHPVWAGKFKIPINANLSQIRAYSHYAYYLSRLVAKSYASLRIQESPGDIDEFRNNYLEKYGTFNLKGLINYAWEIGICVLPLNDSGVFHGAAWNIDGIRVIVVKQNTKSHARWIFDLLHEVYHALAHLDDPNSSIVETQEINPFSHAESNEEKEANTFSQQVLFEDRTEKILNHCVQKTGGKMARLKSVVQNVARSENIREDILANFVAFRLSLDDQNWWGAASALQVTTPDPFSIASDILLKNIATSKINEMERNLLQMAISITE